ncbi:MAG: lamin tail domain-containing protein [Anaerolineales bacterium]|nr:lamin tail domain-containing protein [Anaerolineales bacterium]
MTQKCSPFYPAPLYCAGILFLWALFNPSSLLSLQSTEAPTLTATASSTTTPSPTATVCSASSTPTATATSAHSATHSPVTPGATATLTETPTPSSTPTPTQTPTKTTVSSPPSTPVPARTIFINEVAWAGSEFSSSDEWIELHNPGPEPINLEGWRLSDEGDINTALHGSIASFGYFLLERTDDSTVANIAADEIYTGSLHNSGETLHLYAPSGSRVDSANMSGDGWPAGDSASRASMERRGSEDLPGNWATFCGIAGTGIDAGGHPIHGTPRQPNSIFFPAPTATSPTPSPSPTPGSPGSDPHVVLVNEVAWAGTLASSSDEWIELYNNSADVIDLTGWLLTDLGDIHIDLAGIISPHSYFLLERSDDGTIADLAAHQIYTGGLNNSGETLVLYDSAGNLIDSANATGGSWPAGDSTGRLSMERQGGTDQPGNWGAFTGYGGTGHDANGNPITGSPGSVNSILLPPPAPRPILGRIVINEVLIRPHYDWEGTGNIDVYDEFIELHNLGPSSVYLRNWQLDDVRDGGSAPYTIAGITISPGSYAVFFRTYTRIALNDSGDQVFLLSPDGRVMDQISYFRVRAYNLSFGRLPDGSSRLYYGLWPTPGRPNMMFEEDLDGEAIPEANCCLSGGLPQPRLIRLTTMPSGTAWLADLGQICCRD